MEVTRILEEIDAQISKLSQARALLAGPGSIAPAAAKKSVGRPRKSVAAAPVKQASAKRSLSPEARKRIADAQKKRWAASKKASA